MQSCLNWIDVTLPFQNCKCTLLCDLRQMPRMPLLPQVHHIFMASETQQQGWLNNFESKSSKCITVADPRHLHLSSQKTFHTCLQRSNRMAYLHFPAEQFYRKYEGWCFWVTNLVCYFMQFCFFCIFGFPSAILSFTNTTDSIRHYATSARRVEGKRVDIWSKDMWCMAVFPCFSMFFLHVICCWYYPWIRNPTAVLTRSRDWLNLWGSCYIYQLSLRTVYWYCFSCCDVGLGWLQVWFQEVRWQEELGLDATVWFVDSQEFFSNQHHCLHGITLSYSWWTRYMLHLSREALQNASAEVCCSSVYYASSTCFTLKCIPQSHIPDKHKDIVVQASSFRCWKRIDDQWSWKCPGRTKCEARLIREGRNRSLLPWAAFPLVRCRHRVFEVGSESGVFSLSITSVVESSPGLLQLAEQCLSQRVFPWVQLHKHLKQSNNMQLSEPFTNEGTLCG